MKSKNIFLTLILLLLLCLIAACGASDGSGSMAPSGSYDDTGESDGSVGEGNNEAIQPGQITACAYNDNDHYEFWYNLNLSQNGEEQLFNKYHTEFAFKTLNRIHLTLPKDVPTKVSLLGDNNEVLATYHSDKMGNCYLFPTVKKDAYKIELSYMDNNGEEVKEIKTITGDTTISYEGANTATNNIQLMFVIDATGSMGDEMSYIKAEVIDIIDQVKTANPDVVFELAVMVYRDLSDLYVTKYSDFTQDIVKQQAFLQEQFAQGGGDFEEAVDVALLEASSKQWTENATKIIIHIADAPSHDQDVQEWESVASKLAANNIRIITVASSGIDLKTEYFFRSQSLITNGHYVYITNDSGIGQNHLEATVEKRPTVEYLNSSLVRLINGYYTGVFKEAIYYQQEQ